LNCLVKVAVMSLLVPIINPGYNVALPWLGVEEVVALPQLFAASLDP